MGESEEAIPTNFRAIAVEWMSAFNEALATHRLPALLDLFGQDPWWRDVYAMTWDIVARHGADEIKDLLDSFLQPSGFGAIELDEALPVKLESDAYIEALFTFTTAVGSGRGVLRLLPNQEGRWKAWTISTALEDLTAYPAHEVTIAGLQDDKFNVAATPGERVARVEDAARRADFIDRDPSVLIIGAGHCGLFLAARLRHLGISALVVEAHERVGDNWRNRYSGLVLHEPKWSSQFPYMMFPDGWPLLTPKDLLADWMEAYVRFVGLDVWTDSVVEDAVYDEAAGTWSVAIDRDGTRRELNPGHVVFATGNHGTPATPDVPGIENFSGSVHHSSQHAGGPDLDGKDLVIVGSGSSALDVAQDAYEHGANVTVVQRGPTHILSQRHGIPAFHGAYYSESSPPIEVADLLATSLPTQLAFNLNPYLTRMIAEADRELIDGLEEAGFATTLGPNDSGMMHMTFVRGGGYYIDKGAGQLVVDRKIAVKSSEIDHVTQTEIVYRDGTASHADAVVFCTGYTNMREAARPILGDQVTDSLATVWGLDGNGELRTTFRHCGHENLWFVAGGFRDARIHSKHVALMIAAIEGGLLDRKVGEANKAAEA